LIFAEIRGNTFFIVTVPLQKDEPENAMATLAARLHPQNSPVLGRASAQGQGFAASFSSCSGTMRHDASDA
jgi:hypothetical protein